VAEGIGGVVGHGFGERLRNGIEVETPSRPKLNELGPHRTFSPEMEAGLAILEKYKPEYAELVRTGVIPLEEGPKVGVSGGVSKADRIIVSTDARYPLSTAATLFEEIYHSFQGAGSEQVIELEAKAAMAKWVLEVSEETGLEFNRFSGVSDDILTYEQGGIAGLREWLSQEYRNDNKKAGMLYRSDNCSLLTRIKS
jgi:hypothetical protein